LVNNLIAIYIAVSGLLLSFFFAGAESAFTTSNKLKLEIWSKQRRPLSKTAKYFTRNPELFYITILIGNNVANILVTTFAMVYLISFMDEATAGVLIAIIILFLGEIFPKNLFRLLADKIVLYCLLLTRIFHFPLKPIITTISYMVERLLDILKVKHDTVHDFFSRDELELLLRESGHIFINRPSEQKFIDNVLDFSSSKVREVMIPRTEIVAAAEDVTREQLMDMLIKSGRSQIIIYGESMDNIRGAVFIHDILTTESDIRSLIRPVFYAPENKNCSRLFRELQAQNLSVAVVLDEYGGTAGLVTTRDLIENVFGVFQQKGEKEYTIRALNKNTWIIDARYNLEELSDLLKISFPDGEYETIAGFLLDQLGRFPKKGELFNFDGFRIEILHATLNRISQIKLIKKQTKNI
jgi:CBS domain containing-hemolysin-like protein